MLLREREDLKLNLVEGELHLVHKMFFADESRIELGECALNRCNQTLVDQHAFEICFGLRASKLKRFLVGEDDFRM
jgi:hypothetical protein